RRPLLAAEQFAFAGFEHENLEQRLVTMQRYLPIVQPASKRKPLTVKPKALRFPTVFAVKTIVRYMRRLHSSLRRVIEKCNERPQKSIADRSTKFQCPAKFGRLDVVAMEVVHPKLECEVAVRNPAWRGRQNASIQS